MRPAASLSAFHWAGVKASTVAASPLVAFGRGADLAVEVVDQGLQLGLVGRGSRAPAPWPRPTVRFGIAVVVAWSASAAIREAGSTST